MGLAIVQSAQNCYNPTDTINPTVTLGAAPTSDNLLVAICMSQSSPSFTAGAGWTLEAHDDGALSIAVLTKYAGAGESATQTPNVKQTTQWTVMVWEISGVSGVHASDIAAVHVQTLVTNYPGTSGAPASFSTVDADELVLFAAAGNALANLQYTSSTGILDNQLPGNVPDGAGGTEGGSGWHLVEALAGTPVAPTITSNVGANMSYGAIELVTTVPAAAAARASEMAVLALAEPPPPPDRSSELAVLALAEPASPPARASELAVLSLGHVVPGDRVSGLVILALVDAEPCVTHRCDVWVFTRKDGVILGFTGHDENVTFNGVLCKACGSLSPSATEQTADLQSTGSITLQGIVNHSDIQEIDLYAGVYDDALVEVWRASWDALLPETPVRIAAGWIGKVDHGESGWQVEILGPASRLAQHSITETFTPSCRWVFGSAQCGIDLYPISQGAAVILSPDRATIFADIEDPHIDAQWNNGSITLHSGRNAGYVIETKTVDFTTGLITTWLPVPFPLQPGDSFTLHPGCDKSKGACQLYDNYINFGGFADIAGQDHIVQLPQANY